MSLDSNWQTIASVVLFLTLVCSTAQHSQAQDAPAPIPPVASHIEFDLTSTSPTMTAAAASNAEIKIADTTRAVTEGAQLTPAEYVAYQQVLSSGSQTLVLGMQGQAVGGSFSLGTIIAQPVSNLVVPGNVTAIHDAALAPSITLSGNLTNGGTIYALSTDAAVTTATFNATNIFNQPGALFTSILPTQGLAGFASAISGLNLSLSAVNDIVNNGVISSAGNLNLAAGGSIINQTIGNVAAITATQSLNLAASTLNNAGLISAITGNINIDAANIYNQSVIESIRGNIAISNTIAPELGINIASDSGGIIRALLGEITSTTADTSLKYNTSISGGKILAGEILLTSGEGHLNLNVDDIHGGLRVRAGTASLSVSAGTNGLNIQELSITGDPDLIYSGAGPFVSPAFNSFGGLVNIDTSADTVNGSITFTGNIVTTPPPPGAGGSVTLKAGTTISTQAIITNSGGGGTAGGAIYLSGPQGVTVNGSITSIGQAVGGNVTIVSSSGAVNISGGNIDARASGSSGGNVTIAGNTVTVTNPINTSSVGAFGVSRSGGDILILGQGNVAVANLSAQLMNTSMGATGRAGNIAVFAGTSGTGSLSAGNIDVRPIGFGLSAGTLTLVAPGSITTGNVTAANSGGLPGQVVVAAGKGGSSATMTLGDINTVGAVFGGPVVLVNLGDNGNIATGSISTQSTAGTGGDLSITAPGTIATGAIDTRATAAGQFGGDLWLSSGATSGSGITTTSIDRSGPGGSGQIFALVNPGVIPVLGTITPALGGADFVGTPTSPQAAITGDVTLSVTSGAVTGFNPGGFTLINAPAGTITLNQPVRVPAPIISRSGNLTIGSISGALPFGQTLTLVAPGDISVGSVPAIATGVVRIISTAGAITLPSLNVSNVGLPGGAIGVIGAQGVTLPATSTLLASGTPSGPIGIISPGGSVNIAGTVTTAGGPVTLTAWSLVNVTGTITAGTQTITQLGLPDPRAVVPAAAPSTSSAATVVVAPNLAAVERLPFLGLSFAPAPLNLGIPTDRISFSIPDPIQNADESKILLVAGISSTGTSVPKLETIANDYCQVKFLDGCKIVCAGNNVDVENGQALVYAQRAITLNVGGTKVTLEPGSIVLVHAVNGVVKIANLVDQSSGAVQVKLSDRQIELAAGSEVVAAQSHELLDRALSNDGIGRRHLELLNSDSDNQVSLAEFSMTGFLTKSPLLCEMRKSQDRGDRWIIDSAMKMTACLMHVTRSHGIYTAADLPFSER